MKIAIFKTVIYSILIMLSFQSTFSNVYVKGKFFGWKGKGKTILALSDGTYWIQSGYEYDYCIEINPNVELFRESGEIIMFVEGCNENGIKVEQLTDVIESKIDGEFKGFEGETIFNLKNGTKWKQKEYKYLYKYAYQPDCIVYYYNGWQLSVLDETVEVEKFNNQNRKVNTDNISYLNVNNNTENVISFCYVSFDNNNGWVSNGWYNVEPYSNTPINIGIYSGWIYLYAQANGGEFTWNDKNSDYVFCIDVVNAFTIPFSNETECNKANFKRVNMSPAYINSSVYTWNLNP